MLIGRTCKGTSRGGEPCRTAPLREHDYCLVHSPDHAEEPDSQ